MNPNWNRLKPTPKGLSSKKGNEHEGDDQRAYGLSSSDDCEIGTTRLEIILGFQTLDQPLFVWSSKGDEEIGRAHV